MMPNSFSWVLKIAVGNFAVGNDSQTFWKIPRVQMLCLDVGRQLLSYVACIFMFFLNSSSQVGSSNTALSHGIILLCEKRLNDRTCFL